MWARAVAALAVLVSAAVHLVLWFDGVRHQSVGPSFLLNAFGGAVIAVLLVTWRHWLVTLLPIGFGLSTLAAFTIAATVGLFGVHEHWRGGYVWTAAISEVVAVVAGAVALRAELGAWSTARRTPGDRLSSAAAAVSRRPSGSSRR